MQVFAVGSRESSGGRIVMLGEGWYDSVLAGRAGLLVQK